MTAVLGSSDELTALASAIGLLDGSGNVDPTWFSQPLKQLSGALETPSQREALLRFLDLALPPEAEPGAPPDEKWHPLLGQQANGNLFITHRESTAGAVFGVGGEFRSGAGAAVQGRLRAQADIISAGAAVSPVVGTVQNPIVVEVRVETMWHFDPHNDHPVGLAALVAKAAIVPDPTTPSFGLQVTLEQLDLGAGPADRVLDVAQIGRDAPDLLAALLKIVLAEVGADPTAELLANHLLAVVGLDDNDAIPAFPFAGLASGPAALQNWLQTLAGADGTAPTVGAWLEHLAGLLGGGGAAAGTGTPTDPWTVTLTEFAGIGELQASIALVDGHLRVAFGGTLGASLGAGEPTLTVTADVAFADIPLGGTAHAQVLPAASLGVRISGDAGQPLVDDPNVRIGSLFAGLSWNGTHLAPTLELLNNHVEGTDYAILDLTNVDSVAAVATNLVVDAIDQALGADTGRRLAALAGLVAPEDPAAPGNPVNPWPHHLDLAGFVVNPTRAIASYHLEVLGDTDRWSLLMRELTELIGLGGAIGGDGTEAQPWSVAIDHGDPALELVTWHLAPPGAPGTQELRLGLRLAADAGTTPLALTSEILAFDLSPAGPSAVRLIGAQRIGFSMNPALDTSTGQLSVRLAELDANAAWSPGASLGWEIVARGLSLTMEGESFEINELHLPPAGGFDLHDPAAAAAALGVGLADLANAVRFTLSLLAMLAGQELEVAASLLGLHHGLGGQSAEMPTIVDPADPGHVLQDPLGAVRDWLGRLIEDVGPTGLPSATVALEWLAALAGDALPDDLLGELVPDLFAGGGSFADPWRLPWPGAPDGGGPDLELWLEPEGPPASWAGGVVTQAQSATEMAGLAAAIVQLSWFDPALRSLVRGLSTRDLTERLDALQTNINAGDGVVETDSEGPDVFGWAHGDDVDAPHHLLPSHENAIAQTLTQIEALVAAGGGPRTVLLIGPAFADSSGWADLLASPQLVGPVDAGAHFDLRTPGIDPATISLDGVTAVADYYTADLQDDGSGDAAFMAGQIGHIADRLAVLHPGPLIIVAHSYAGLAARRFAADTPARVQGLITIGTPHLGAPLAFLSDVELGDALRIAATTRPTMPASVLRDALDHLMSAIEGYVPPATAGALSTPNPYPSRSFGMAAPFDIGDIPVLTLGGTITDDVFAWLQAAVVAHAQAVAAEAKPAPTHLAYGMAMPMAIGEPPPGTPAASACTRFGLGQIPFAAGAAAPARPAHLLRVELELRSGTSWLVGAPGPSDVDGRLRGLLVGVTATAGATGVAATVDATLDQAAWRGTTAATAAIGDPAAAPLIGAGFDAVLATTDDPNAPVSSLASALGAIDLLATDASGTVGLSNDGFTSLRTDPVGYLAARIPNALAQPAGWAGLTVDGALEGGYVWTPPGSPYGLFARRETPAGGWRVGIETDTAGSSAAAVNVGVDLDIELPKFTPTLEACLNIGAASLHYRTIDGTISLSASPWLEDVVLWPSPSIDDLASHFNEGLPRLLMSGALGAVLGDLVPGLDMTALEQLLQAPGTFLTSAGALGLDGGGLDAGKLGGLLATLNSVAGLPAGPGLQLPGGISIEAAAGSTPGSATLTIATTAPIGGILQVALTAEVDSLRHVAPGGSITLETPLTGTWPHVSITFGVGASGVTLVVTPQGTAPITLLPAFSGLGALRGAAAALLPQALDSAVATHPAPRPLWLQHLLAAAASLGVYDDPGGFAAHSAALTAMLDPAWFENFNAARRADVAAAIVDVVTLVPGLPGSLTSAGGLVHWTFAFAPPAEGAFDVAAGWGTNGATLQIAAQGIKPANAPLVLSASAAIDDTGVDITAAFGVDLSTIGIALVPQVVVDLDVGSTTRLAVRFEPLSDGTAPGPLIVELAPVFGVTTGAGTAEQILVGWALPLAVEVAVQALQPALLDALWAGGPTLKEALTHAGILVNDGVAHPLPSIFEMLAGFLVEVSSLLDLPLGDLHIRLTDDAHKVGISLSGQQSIPLGDLELTIAFGAPASWGTAAGEGLVLNLLDTSGLTPQFEFGLEMHGVGVGLSNADGTALVSETYLRLGSVKALVFMDIETTPTFQVLHGGAGIELGGFGIPIGSALGAGGGSDPVASSILGSGGSGGGDAQQVNPVTDLDVWYWADPANVGGPLRVLVGGQQGLFWIPIHAGFGPIFISEIGFGLTNTSASLAIDGGVSIAGLSATVDGLEVTAPFAHLSDPSKWAIDLKGLAIGYSGPEIAIAGGLLKFDGPPIEYDGMLLVEIGDIGAVVIGSYAVVGSGADQYTSLAIFGGVFVPIGIPPIIELSGFALGLGYNRRLIVPEDLNQIPNFMLVEALDRPEALANNPMQALYAFRDQVPPARGALWFAAGVRGTSFELVNVTAVLYVALDNGVDVGLLGVARMALPTDDAAIVSIELALKVRFSTAEGLFSVQAQLTDNSWLISHDCQLTGGFAYFMWFSKSQFLLTMGGYHPSFKPLPEYPVVPRLGYRWDFLGVVQIKGESYFALTNTAVMTGTRLEATYGPDWIQVWFTAYTDILVSWDPFHYEIEIGISVGARIRIRVCVFGVCATIELSVSVGASLQLEGPPFHGIVTADLGVTSISVPFGDDARALPPAKSWGEFVAQYIQSGDANAPSVNAQISSGLLPAEPPGGPVAPGTDAQPWRLSAEWAFDTQTKMPARGFRFQVDTPRAEADMAAEVFGQYDGLSTTYDIDIAPMYTHATDLTTRHSVVIAKRTVPGGAFQDLVPRNPPSGADVSLLIDETLFRVTPRIGQLSEATYHFFPDLKPPAAANTVPALVGIHVDGIAGLEGATAPIPIGQLVDATDYRPLPFAHRTPLIVEGVIKAGLASDQLTALTAGAPHPNLLGVFETILSGSTGDFADLRVASRLPQRGYGPVATSALTGRRSAPPLLASLSEGFTLEDVGRGVPAPAVAVPPVMPVPLDGPRLRSVMQRSLLPTGGTPTIRTTAAVAAPALEREGARMPVVNVQRDLVTQWASSASALVFQERQAAPRPTRTARSTRTVRHPALGGAVGRSAAEGLEALAKQVLVDGVTIRAGACHLWELPAGSFRLQLSGNAAVRITEITSAGTVLRDRELPLAEKVDLQLLAGSAMIAVAVLGELPASAKRLLAVLERDAEAGAQASVSIVASPPGTIPVVGWQLGSLVAQVGPTTLLGRGSTISLTKTVGSNLRRHLAATGMIALSRATLAQEVVQTELPRTVSTIGVLVDHDPQATIASSDVVIHTEGATLAAPGLQVEAGKRTAYLYDVAVDDTAKVAAGTISVAVGLRTGLTLAGVFGASGTAEDWADSLAGSTLTQIVPDEQLTPNGAVTLKLAATEGNGNA